MNSQEEFAGKKKRGLFRSLVLWGVFVTLTTVMGLPVMILLVPFRASNMIHKIAITWGTILSHISGAKLKVENLELLVKNEPVIYLANHQSLYDVITIFSFLKTQFRFMAKASLFKLPIIGWVMYAMNYIPVERDNRKKSLNSLYQAADIIKKGTSVILFPEGTRGHLDGTMRPFKGGAFLLAKKAKVTLQPITIQGALNVVPKIPGVLIQRIYPGEVKVTIHAPILFEEADKLSTDELSDFVRQTIASALPTPESIPAIKKDQS